MLSSEASSSPVDGSICMSPSAPLNDLDQLLKVDSVFMRASTNKGSILCVTLSSRMTSASLSSSIEPSPVLFSFRIPCT